jgi:hypothetical protein
MIDWALTGDAWIFRENGKVFDARHGFTKIFCYDIEWSTSIQSVLFTITENNYSIFRDIVVCMHWITPVNPFLNVISSVFTRLLHACT